MTSSIESGTGPGGRPASFRVRAKDNCACRDLDASLDIARRIARAAATPGVARLSSADGYAIVCVGGRPRTSTSRSSAFAQDRLPLLLAPLGRVEPVGQSFPVYKLIPPGGSAGEIDVALPRRESKRGRGHKGFEVHGDPSMSIAEAARRRDFTINAISWDPLTEHVRRSLRRPRRSRAAAAARRRSERRSRTIACVRCARCSSPRGSSSRSTTQTAALCRDASARRSAGGTDLGRDREAPAAGRRGRRSASRSRSISASSGSVLPELLPLVGCEQEPEWHPEGDVWTHTLMVIDKARELNGDLDRPRLITVMLGAVCHDLGKPPTTAVVDGRIRSLDHEQAGVEPTLALLDRLNIHTIDGFDVRGQVVGLVAHHLKPGAFHKAANVSDGAFRRLAQKVDLELLARVARADCLGRAGDFDCSAMDWFIERARALGVEHHPPAPLLLGRHLLALGLAPGPRVGEILKQVYEKQLDGEVTISGGGIEEARRLICRMRASPLMYFA